MTIEVGPAKHAVQQTFFLYTLEPGGNRVELITDGRLILSPDWPRDHVDARGADARAGVVDPHAGELVRVRDPSA